MVGSLGPWASILGLTAAGTDGDGVYTLAFAIIAGIALWRALVVGSSGMLIGCAANSAIVLAIGAYHFQRISRGLSSDELSTGNELSDAFAEGLASTVSVGWGLYLVVLGALATIGASVAAWRLQTNAPA